MGLFYSFQHEEEMVKKALADAERKRQREEERRLRKERGEEVDSDEEDEEETEDDDWEPFVPEDPSPILQAFYDPNAGNNEKNFWVSMVIHK